MAAEPAALRDMEAFVRALFQEKPDLSILTNAMVRKKYLLHAGQKSMTKEEKEQLRHLVEEELDRMEDDDSTNAVEFMADFKTRFNSRSQKRPRCSSDTSSEELGIQELKKQRTGSMPEVGSDEEDSGIDSKKIPLHRGPKHAGAGKSSSSSDQRDSGAEGHTGGSESDGQNGKKSGEPPLSGKGRKPTRERQSRGQRDRSGSESKETTEEEGSDLEEIRKQKKEAKGRRTESDSERELSNYKPQKMKGVGKEQKRTEMVGKGKNRKRGEQSIKKEDESEKETELPKAGKMRKVGRADGSESKEEMKGGGSKKAQNRPKRRALEAQEESESEDESESDSENEKPIRQKKRRNSKPSRKSVRAEELGSDSDSAGGTKESRRASEKCSRDSEGGSEDEQAFKRQARKGMQKTQNKKALEEKKQGRRKPPKRSPSSEESESEMGEGKGSEQKIKGTGKPSNSKDESCSEAEEMERGKSKSNMSEDGSEESESGNQRKKRVLKKKDESVSGSESSSEAESLRKKGEKSQGKGIITEKNLGTDSEDSGSGPVGRKKPEGPRKTGAQKPQRRREESSGSGDEDDPPSSKLQRKGKDKEQRSGKHEEHPSVRRLKRYIRECGVHRNYKKLLDGCRSRKAQLKVLKEELENLGLKGTPSLAKCKALKQKRETAAEVASLDVRNIITTQGRPRRRNVWSLYSKPEEQPSSPEDSPIRGPVRDWSHLQGIISSDGESD